MILMVSQNIRSLILADEFASDDLDENKPIATDVKGFKSKQHNNLQSFVAVTNPTPMRLETGLTNAS